MLHAMFFFFFFNLSTGSVFTKYGHGGHLVYVSWVIFINKSVSLPIDALIGQAVSERKIFEYYGNIHVYSPGAGADKPMGSLDILTSVPPSYIIHVNFIFDWPRGFRGNP